MSHNGGYLDSKFEVGEERTGDDSVDARVAVVALLPNPMSDPGIAQQACNVINSVPKTCAQNCTRFTSRMTQSELGRRDRIQGGTGSTAFVSTGERTACAEGHTAIEHMEVASCELAMTPLAAQSTCQHRITWQAWSRRYLGVMCRPVLQHLHAWSHSERGEHKRCEY